MDSAGTIYMFTGRNCKETKRPIVLNMPKLRVLRKDHAVTCEDLLVLAISGCCVNIFWIPVLSYVLLIHPWDPSCNGESDLIKFYTVALIFEIGSLLFLVGMICLSTRGTLINSWPRRHFEHAMSAMAALQVVRLLYALHHWIVLAYFENLGECDTLAVKCMRWTVNVFWVRISITMFLIVIFYHPRNLYEDETKPKTRRLALRRSAGSFEPVTSQLRRRFSNKWLKVKRKLGMTSHPGIHRANELLQDHLWEDLVSTLSPTDVLAGLYLTREEQKKHWKQVVDKYFSLKTSPSEICDRCVKPQEWMTIENATYFLKYAKASYGWQQYVFSHGFREAWSLYREKISGSHHQIIHGDDSLLHCKTILRGAGLPMDDLIYVSFVNKGFELPFFVAIDHGQRSIVVAVRGTMSLDDVVTDFNVFESEDTLTIDGVEDARAHEGLLSAAQIIAQKLIGHIPGVQWVYGFQHHLEKPVLDMVQERFQCVAGAKDEEYRLVVVGHSLGAGVASLLATLLRQEERNKNVMCFAYAPLGGSVSVSLAAHCEKFVCSVVLQDDFVPRMRLHNTYDLKIRVLKTIRNCDIPKHVIFSNIWLQIIGRLVRVSWFDKEDALGQPAKWSWEGDVEAEKAVRSLQHDIDLTIDNLERKKKFSHPMLPPGCILFIREVPNYRVEGGQTPPSKVKSYDSVFVRGDSKLLSELVISSKMIFHHLSVSQEKALKGLLDSGSKPTVFCEDDSRH